MRRIVGESPTASTFTGFPPVELEGFVGLAILGERLEWGKVRSPVELCKQSTCSLSNSQNRPKQLVYMSTKQYRLFVDKPQLGGDLYV